MGVSPKKIAIWLQWDNYEELKTGVLQHFAFPVCAWLNNYLPGQ
jgi:hypothetical protein